MAKEDFKELINNLINIMRKNELMTMTDEKIWSELVSVDPLTNRVLGNMTDEIFPPDVSKLNNKQITKIIYDMDWRNMRSWLQNMQDEQLLSLFVKITDKGALDLLLDNMTDETFLVLVNGTDEHKLWNLICKLDSVTINYDSRMKINMFTQKISEERFRIELAAMNRDELAMFVQHINNDNLGRTVENITEEKLFNLFEDLKNDDRARVVNKMTNKQLRILVKDMSVDQYVNFVRTITKDENDEEKSCGHE